jgi:hypothetical protein
MNTAGVYGKCKQHVGFGIDIGWLRLQHNHLNGTLR